MFKYGILEEKNAQDELSNFLHEYKFKSKNLAYCSIGFTYYKDKKSKIIMQNNEWIKSIRKNEINKYCPIFKAFDSTRNNYIFLSKYKYITQIEKKILNERKNFENTKGILKIFRNKDFKFSISACTGYKNFDEEDFLIKEHEFFKNLCIFSENLVKKYLLTEHSESKDTKNE